MNYSLLFPFEVVPYGARVVIYGAGEAGQECVRQLQITGYAKIVCFLDKMAGKMPSLDVPVYSPEQIRELDYDYVVLAFLTNIWKRSVLEKLQKLGVPPKKIINILPRKQDLQDCSVIEAELVSRVDLKKLIIAFKISGGIGDIIFCKSVIDAVVSMAHECLVDLFADDVNKFLPDLFYGEKYVRHFIDGGNVKFKQMASFYDLAIDASNVNIIHDNLASADARYRNLKQAITAVRIWNESHDGIGYISAFVRVARALYLGKNCYTWRNCGGALPINDMHVRLQLNNQSLSAFHRLALNHYITVSYGSGTGDRPEDKQAKQWPFEYYVRLVELLHAYCPGIDVLQLGTTDAQAIPGASKCIFGEKLALVEHILAHSLLHIDNEGGLAHLATQLGTKCIVLFGPTRADFFGYPQNMNVQVGKCHGCWAVYPDFRVCARGLEVPECMSAITPEIVMAKVKEYLSQDI